MRSTRTTLRAVAICLTDARRACLPFYYSHLLQPFTTAFLLQPFTTAITAEGTCEEHHLARSSDLLDGCTQSLSGLFGRGYSLHGFTQILFQMCPGEQERDVQVRTELEHGSQDRTVHDSTDRIGT